MIPEIFQLGDGPTAGNSSPYSWRPPPVRATPSTRSVADGGRLTVHAEGAGGSLVQDTLIGGSSKALPSTTPDLDMGGLIVRDDAEIDLGSSITSAAEGGTADAIESVDSASGQALFLQQALQYADESVTLNLAVPPRQSSTSAHSA